jgi:hypothetical protein
VCTCGRREVHDRPTPLSSQCYFTQERVVKCAAQLAAGLTGSMPPRARTGLLQARSPGCAPEGLVGRCPSEALSQ